MMNEVKGNESSASDKGSRRLLPSLRLADGADTTEDDL